MFIGPVVVLLGLFIVVPILMAAWVSVSDWNGNGSPLSSTVHFVGGNNYSQLLTQPGLSQRQFGTSIRNNFYYVLFVVPLQTVVALFLAALVNRKARGLGFFRTAYYFPSVTSSVAITVLFLFLFNPTGTANKVLSYVGIVGPSWFNDPRGIIQVVLSSFGVNQAAISSSGLFLGLSWWDWLSGPSVAMCVFILMAIFTTSGTFMLLFLAALQGIDESIHEAAMLDGATEWTKFRYVTLPMIKPTVLTVVTLGVIGTWQIFDQIYTGTQGGPGDTTLTPAFLSYNTSFLNQQWGQGAAIAFILFAVIITFTLLLRFTSRERDSGSPRKTIFRRRPPAALGGGATQLAVNTGSDPSTDGGSQ